jgi:hypothetical protein
VERVLIRMPWNGDGCAREMLLIYGTMRSETMIILGSRENLREFLKAVKEQRESSRHCFTALYPAQRGASIGHLIGPTSGH